MMLRNNKKGFFPGWEYIAGFFVVAILFVFAVGMYDFTLVEVYDPIHEELADSLDTLGIDNSSLAVQKFNENYTTTHSKNIPFNLLFIFIFLNAIVMSVINVGKAKRLDPMGLIFKTIGGLIFFIYLMQIAIFKVVTYFKVEIIDYLFTDLIASYVPFYLFTYDNAGLIILMWGAVLILVNWYFGKTEQELSFGGGFQQ